MHQFYPAKVTVGTSDLMLVDTLLLLLKCNDSFIAEVVKTSEVDVSANVTVTVNKTIVLTVDSYISNGECRILYSILRCALILYHVVKSSRSVHV